MIDDFEFIWDGDFPVALCRVGKHVDKSTSCDTGTSAPKKSLKKGRNRRRRRKHKSGQPPSKDSSWRNAAGEVKDYRKYIKSDEWQAVRARALRHYRRRCCECGSRDELQVHHRTYVRIGRERMEDLEVLCKWCHMARHEDKVQDIVSRRYSELVDSF